MTHHPGIEAVLFLILTLGGSLGVGARPAASERIDFSSDLDAALEAAAVTGKPVVLVFGAVWCPNCRWMEEVTLRSPAVVELADRFHWVFVDIDRNLTLANRWNVLATPTIYFLDSSGESRRRIVGAVPPEEYRSKLLALIDQIADHSSDAVLVDDPANYSKTEVTLFPRGYRGRSVCFSHVGYGPMRIASQSPFQSLRLALVPRTPSTLGRQQWEVKSMATWANVWAIDDAEFGGNLGDVGDYLLDYETQHTSLAVGYGVTDTLQLEIGVENRTRFGGSMDSITQGFHDLFSIDQNGRDALPKGDFNFLLAPPGQPPISLGPEDRGSFSRQALLTVQHNVTCGTRKLPAFSYAFTGRWGLQSDDLADDDFDFGVSVAASRRFKKLYAYLTLGYSWFDGDEFRGLALRDEQFSGLLAAEWRWRARTSWILQVLITEGVAAGGFEPFSEASHEITLGWKSEIRRLGVLEVGLIENLISFDNSPDFGVHAGYTQRF